MLSMQTLKKSFKQHWKFEFFALHLIECNKPMNKVSRNGIKEIYSIIQTAEFRKQVVQIHSTENSTYFNVIGTTKKVL